MRSPAAGPTPGSAPGPRLIRRPEQAALLLDPVRQRLLRNLEYPISAAGLARRLRLPRQKVNYHLRELERAGFVRLVEERRVGNCTERLMQADARTVRLDPELFGPLAPEPRTPAEWERLVEVRFATPEDRFAFERDLSAALDQAIVQHGIPADQEPAATGGMGDVNAPGARPTGPSIWNFRISAHPHGRRRRSFPNPAPTKKTPS